MSEDVIAMRVYFRLIRLQTRIRNAIASRARKFGLSTSQCDVLATLSEKEGMTQQELARRLYVTKGNISGLIDRLAEANLVERRMINGNRRSHALYLTEEGRKLAEMSIGMQRAFVHRSIGRINAERMQQLEQLLIDMRVLVRQEEGITQDD